MAPYRTTLERPKRDAPDAVAANDDRVLGVLLLVVGTIRVAIALARHEVFETESSIALFMIVMAFALLLRGR